MENRLGRNLLNSALSALMRNSQGQKLLGGSFPVYKSEIDYMAPLRARTTCCFSAFGGLAIPMGMQTICLFLVPIFGRIHDNRA